MKKLLFLIIILLSTNIIMAKDHDYTNEEICQSIYIIEGGQKTKFPYGIKSVKCTGKNECEKICLNTVENNRKRYSQYGYKKYGTFLEFLQSRYCPLSDDKCENWLPNLNFYLKKME